MEMKKTLYIAYVSVMTAVALIFSYIEFLIPIDLGFPGAKLGLANAAITSVLFLFDIKTAFTVQLLRIVLSGLLFSSPMAMLYSLAGGMLSFWGMVLIRKTGKFSIVGVSTAGGVLLNDGQLAVALFALETVKLAYYLPVLIIAGTLTGLVIGIISKLMIKYMPEGIIKRYK